MSDRSDSSQISLICAAFFFSGLTAVLLGPLIPELIERWGVSRSQIAVLFPAQFITSSLGSLVSTFHLRRSLIAGYGLIGVGLVGLVAGGWPLGGVAAGLLGFGLGLTISSSNLTVARWSHERRGQALAKLNTIWGLGAISSPLFFAVLPGRDSYTAALYGLAAIAVVVCAALATKLEDVPVPAPRPDRPAPATGVHGLLLLAALFFLYVGVENTLGGWLVTLADDVAAKRTAVSLVIGSGFWAALVLGRAATAIALHRLSETALYKVALTIAAAGLTLVLMATTRPWIAAGAIIAGLGLGPIFPLNVSFLASETAAANSRRAGWAFAFGGLGGAALPWLTGRLMSDSAAAQNAFVVPLAGLAVLTMVFVAHRSVGRRAALAATVVLTLLAPGCASSPLLTTSPAKEARDEAPGWRYALVIDASSSASRLDIYEWRPSSRGLPEIRTAPFGEGGDTQPWSQRVRPGLGAYAGRPLEAAASLEPLVSYAIEKLGNDPEILAGTRLDLRATAGLRQLSPKDRNDILEEVETYLETTPFGTISARILSGEEEGVYGWVAANYLLGHLSHGGLFPTVGALDLGGGSTQITFVPLDHPTQNERSLRIGANVYRLYTKSYPGLGQDDARRAVDSPACFLVNYPLPDGRLGSGDYQGCRQSIRQAFAERCTQDSCNLLGAYQPPLYGDFLAFSVYSYTAAFFDLGGRLRPLDLRRKGQDFCDQDWAALTAADPQVAADPFFANYCFAAAYIDFLLTEVFGFADDTERVSAPLRVQGTDTGWTLGALLDELATAAAAKKN